MDKAQGFLNLSVKQEDCNLLTGGVNIFPVFLSTLSFRPPENSYQCLNVIDAYQHSVSVCSRISETTNSIQRMIFLPVQKTSCRPLQGEKERFSLSDLQ